MASMRPAIVFCLAFACVHPSGKEQQEAATIELQSSSEVSRHDPIAQHTVAIADPDPRIGAFCTAVVLGPHTLLSSARCFGDKDKIPFAWFEQSTEGLPEEERFISIPIRRVALHVQYQKERWDNEDNQLTQGNPPTAPSTPLYDLALAWLDEAIPESYTPVSLAGTQADLHQSRLVQAGYGCLDPVCEEDALQLHKTPVEAKAIFPQAAYVVLKSPAARGTCRGDMGGPYFQVSSESVRLVALSSSSPRLCEQGILGESLVAPFQVWIEQAQQNLERGDFKKSNLVQIIDFDGKS